MVIIAPSCVEYNVYASIVKTQYVHVRSDY